MSIHRFQKTLGISALALMTFHPVNAEEIIEIPTDVEILLQALAETGVVKKKDLPYVQEAYFRLKKEADAQKAPPPVPVATKGRNEVTIAQDLRVRYETTSVDDKTAADGLNERLRARYRLTLTSQLEEKWKGAIRLVTGEENNPTSTNETFGPFFSKKTLRVDTLTLTRDLKGGAKITIGMFADPTPTTFAMWDGDVTSTGAAWQKSYPKMFLRPDVTVGAYMLEYAKGANPSLFNAQLGLNLPNERTRIALGIRDYEREDVIATAQGQGRIGGNKLTNTFTQTQVKSLPQENDLTLSPSGAILRGRNDSTNDTYAFTTDYRPMDLLFTHRWMKDWKPGHLTVHAIKNVTTGHRDGAWLFGAGWGKPELVGEWQWDYAYAHIQADAVLSAFNDSDFAATNVKGHRFNLTRLISKNKTLGITFFHTQKVDKTLVPNAGQDREQNRMQIDLQTKF